jgi:DNA-binding FrmR family transcriptional regulator
MVSTEADPKGEGYAADKDRLHAPLARVEGQVRGLARMSRTIATA